MMDATYAEPHGPEWINAVRVENKIVPVEDTIDFFIAAARDALDMAANGAREQAAQNDDLRGKLAAIQAMIEGRAIYTNPAEQVAADDALIGMILSEITGEPNNEHNRHDVPPGA